MKRKERFFGILLSLVLMLGLMAGMSLSAHAETSYNVWVGGVQVTSANRDNVLAGDPENDGKVSFTPADGSTPAKLTLSGATITGSHEDAAIYAEGDLTIDVTEDSTVTGPETDDSYGVINSGGSLTVTGSGKLTATGGKATYGASYGVFVFDGSVTVAKGAKLTAAGGAAKYADSCGVFAYGVYVYEGGTLIASGGTATNGASYGVLTSETVTVNGTLIASGGTATNLVSCGVSANKGVIVDTGAKLTAEGDTQAIDGSVKNAVAGTGWTNTAGTEGTANIAANEQGQTLNRYRKVQFPAVVSYDVWVGGTQVTSANMNDVLAGDPENDGKVSFTPATESAPAILTLNGATITSGSYRSAAIYAEGDLTVNVAADSTVTGPRAGSSYGVFNYDGSLTVTGSGTLTAEGGTADNHGNSYGVFAFNGGVTVAAGGTLTAASGTAEGMSFGVSTSRGAVTVAEGGELTATGGTSTEAFSSGVYVSEGAVTVNGKLTAEGGTANLHSLGFVGDSVTVNGTLTAAGGTSTYLISCGVLTSETVTVNGTLIASGSTATNGASYGVSANKGVIVDTGAKLTASGDTQAIGGSVKNAIAGTGWTDAAGTEGKENITVDDQGQDLRKYRKVQLPTLYDVWVGGVQVTGANMNDVLGSADGDGATVTYIPATDTTPATLTLSGARITNGSYNYAAIYATEELTIDVAADSTVTGPDNDSGNSYGVYNSGGSLTVTGPGTLTAEGGTATGANGYSYGVLASGDVTVSGTLTAEGGKTTGANGYSCGVYAENGAVIVNGTLTGTGGTAAGEGGKSYGVCVYEGAVTVTVNGTLTATGGEAYLFSYGIFAERDITVNGTVTAMGGKANRISGGVYEEYGFVTVTGTGTLTATGGAANEESYGVFVFNGSVTVAEGGTLTAEGGAAGANGDSYGVYAYEAVTVTAGGTLTATGDTQAIGGSVKNAIAGTGWTNTAGTQGKENIAVNDQGQDLSKYRKAQFPALYDVWVGGVRVTGANMGNVLIGDPVNDDKVSYTPATDSTPAILTLNSAEITSGSHEGAAIYATEDLTIDVTADSTVTGPEATSGPGYGVYSDGSLTVTGSGELTVTGGTQAIYGSVKNLIGGTGWTDAAGTEGMANIAASDQGQTLNSYKKVRFSVVVYPVWIGGVQANESNCDKLSDNFWSYDPAAHILTLSGYTYQGQGYVYSAGGEGAAIYYNGADDLTVTLTGENHITLIGTKSGDCGIVSDNDSAALTFSGDGSLLIDSVGNFKYYNSAVYGRAAVIFQSGSYKLGNNDADYGVRVDSGCFVDIEDGITSFEAAGYLAAVNGLVRNAVEGTGYNSFRTLAGRVQISATGAELTYTSGLQTKYYQIATFPAGTYTVVFDPGDGTGTMDPTQIGEGEKLKLPACTFTPPKDNDGNDKVFNWWEVSGVDGIFFVDSEVLIANNCASGGVVTVTAKWKAKTQALILADAEGQELDYTGSAQELLSQNGVANGGTMVYAIGGDNVTAPTDGWNAAQPSETDAGTYYVWYKVAADAEHFDSEARCTTAKINKAAARTIADMETELLYTATSVSASVAGKMPDDAGTLTYTAGDLSKTGSVAVSNFMVDAAGLVSAELSGGAARDTVTLPVTISSVNYADSTVNVKITLTPKGDAGVTVSGVPTQAGTYGDADFTLTGSVTNAGTGTGIWTWSASDDSVFQITADGATATVKILKAGSATVSAGYESDTTVDTETTAAITVNPKTITITAKDQSIYVGDAVPTLSGADFYTVAGLVGEETLTTNPTLAYQKNGSAAAPDNTAAGTYDIVASGASAGGNYNISYTNGTLTISAKGTQTIAAENVTATYGDTGKSVSATVTDPATGGGQISYAVKTGSEDYINVDAESGALTIKKVPADGKAYVIVTAAETAAYAQATRDVTVTINKASAAAATVTANNRTYDGTEKPLVTVTGTATGGEMHYALGTATEATEQYTTSIPAKTEARTYYVWYKAAGDDNHNDTEAAKVLVTVGKATVTAPTIASKEYTGETQTADVAASTLYSVTTNNGGTNVGSYDVVLTLTDSANYKWTDSTAATKTLSFQITKATANTVTVNIEGWTYGEAAKAPTSTATFGTAAYTYADKGGTDFSATVPTTAGNYTVKAAVAGTANYPASEATADFTIAKASINPTVSITGWTVGEAANEPGVTGNAGGGAVTYTYADKGSTDFSGTVPTDAGEYTVKATIAATANYNGAEATADFTIAKIVPLPGVDFSVEPLQLTYTGSPQKLVRQTIQTEGLEIVYSFDYGVSVETGLPMKKASGEYLICYRVIGNEIYETLDWSEPMLATIRMYATFSNPDFVLPPFLSEIGEEAFAEDTSITVVDAGGCAIIDAYAFGDCANLKRIRLPQDCEIDDTAFDGCEALRMVFAPGGGTTAAWCASHGINFVPESQN